MGKLFDGDDEVPEVPFTNYNVNKAASNASFAPINFSSIYDDVAGEEFTFIRGLDGQRYLELNRKIEEIEEKGSLNNGRNKYIYSDEYKQLGELKKERDLVAETERDMNGLKRGQVSISSKSTRDRIPLDAPLNVNEVNIDLPQVGDLRDFNMRYAAAVAVLTGELRDLGNSIQVMQNTAPELIPQVTHIVEPYKIATQRAMDKGFDIYRNGLDKKLIQMGLSNSSTALGSQIALQRDRVDAEIKNALEIAQLGHGIKKDVIAGQFQLGEQKVKEAVTELNRYNSESQNELTARQQDLGKEQLVQQRGFNQANLNLSQEQLRVNTELERRKIAANVAIHRNPMNSILGYNSSSNQQALAGIQGDNQALNNQNMTQVAKQNSETQRFQVNQAAQSDPFGQLLTIGAGAALGGMGGGFGTMQGLKLGGMTTEQAADALAGKGWGKNK